MRNDFIPGPRYKASRDRFMDDIPETSSIGGAALSLLAWEDSFQAAQMRLADSMAELARDMGEAILLPRAFARLKSYLKGEK